MGERALTSVQYGVESAHGTEVNATKILQGAEAVVPRDRIPSFPQESLGVRARSMRSEIYQIHVETLPVRIEHGYFQALPLIFGSGVKGNVTAAEQTESQSDYLWAFAPSMTAANNPVSFTMEVKEDVQPYTIEYCLTKRIRLAGRVGVNEPVNIEFDMFGKQVTPKAATAALSLAAVEPMIANLSEIYIDTTWANLGNTQKTDILREFNIEILTGVHPKFHGDSKLMTADAESWFEVMANFVFEGNANADAIFDAMQAQTEQAIRVKMYGSQIGAGDVHSCVVDMFGTWEEVTPLGQTVDGNNLHTALFHAYYDDTGAVLFDVNVTTDSNAY